MNVYAEAVKAGEVAEAARKAASDERIAKALASTFPSYRREPVAKNLPGMLRIKRIL